MDRLEYRINRVYSWVFPLVLGALGWMLQNNVYRLESGLKDSVTRLEHGLNEMNSTLKKIQVDVQALNQDVLLRKQEVNFRLKAMEEKISKMQRSRR